MRRGGAQRGANSELALARRGARQQQIRHVRAGDDQHESNGAYEQQQRGADIAHQGVLHRERLRRESRIGFRDRWASPFEMDASSAFAASKVTPGFMRPITRSPGRDARVRSSTEFHCSIGT